MARCNAYRRPSFAIGWFAAHSVHRDGDFPIGPLAAELSDDLHWARMAILRIASASHPGHTQLGVADALISRSSRFDPNETRSNLIFPNSPFIISSQILVCRGDMMNLIAESFAPSHVLATERPKLRGKHPCKRISASLGGEADGGSRTRNSASRSSLGKRRTAWRRRPSLSVWSTRVRSDQLNCCSMRR
jgi:hypothetical protein